MSSEKTKEMETQLAGLHCPFTWDMEEVIKSKNSLTRESYDDREVAEDSEDLPLHALMHQIMVIYEHTKKGDLKNALKELEECDEMLAAIEKEKPDDLSKTIKAVQHVVKATKCHVLYEDKKLEEVKTILKEIHPVSEMNKEEKGALYGLQSLAWSAYRMAENMNAINFVKDAIALNPKNATWHFVLAKNLRRLRRAANISMKPTDEELQSYEKALKLSQNPTFAISYAQLHRENGDKEQAAKMYMKALTLNPECSKLQLRLALGFIRTRRNDLARKCLDYVFSKTPNSSMYFHYEGIYYEKCRKDNTKALKYYKKAVDLKNFAAEINYVQCRMKVERTWDPLSYFLDMQERYKDDGRGVIQKIKLHIGSCYFDCSHDLVNACKYFLDAIEMDPKNVILKTYNHCLRCYDFNRVNIYTLLEKEICPILKNKPYLDKETNEMIKKALKVCRENEKTDTTVDPFDKMFEKLKL